MCWPGSRPARRNWPTWPAVTLVEHAAVEAKETTRLADAPSLVGALVETDSRSARVASVLMTWTVGINLVDEAMERRRLPIGDLHLRRLRLLARIERPLDVMGRFCRIRPATHMAALRWALRLLAGALREAEIAEPLRRARLLADVAADFALIRGDIVASHAAALGPFLRWRATSPLVVAGRGDACQPPLRWY